MSMSQAARLDVRERAAAQRSDVEAQLTVEAQLRAEEWNVLRYMAPPEDTPFPLEYAFHLLGDVAGKHVLDLGLWVRREYAAADQGAEPWSLASTFLNR